MSIKKFLSLERLTDYDSLIKAKIDGDIDTLATQVAYIDAEDNENVSDIIQENYVKTVNGVAPDVNGNVVVKTGGSDATLIKLYLNEGGAVNVAYIGDEYYEIDPEDADTESALYNAIISSIETGESENYNIIFRIEDASGGWHISTNYSHVYIGGNYGDGFKIYYDENEYVRICSAYISV